MVDENKKLRLFVAIELPESIGRELENACTYFKKNNLFIGRCTTSANFHVTIKFLGDVKVRIIEDIDAQLRQVAFTSWDAHLGTLGIFSSEQQMDILFANIVCPPLSFFAQEINKVLMENFGTEQRSFVPHVTLARIKKINDRKIFLNELSRFVFPFLQWKIDSFVLKSSFLTKDGPIYNVLRRYHC